MKRQRKTCAACPENRVRSTNFYSFNLDQSGISVHKVSVDPAHILHPESHYLCRDHYLQFSKQSTFQSTHPNASQPRSTPTSSETVKVHGNGSLTFGNICLSSKFFIFMFGMVFFRLKTINNNKLLFDVLNV